MRRQIEQALLLVIGALVGLVMVHLPYGVLETCKPFRAASKLHKASWRQYEPG